MTVCSDLKLPGVVQEMCMQASAGLWLAGNEGMEKKMETTIMRCLVTTIRIHSFIPR